MVNSKIEINLRHHDVLFPSMLLLRPDEVVLALMDMFGYHGVTIMLSLVYYLSTKVLIPNFQHLNN